MPLTIGLLSVAFLSLVVVFVVAIRKVPQLRLVDPASSQEAKDKRRKRDLLRRRLERLGGEQVRGVATRVSPVWQALQSSVRSVAARLTAAERRYKTLQREGTQSVSKEDLERMVQDAEAKQKVGEYQAAEKLLIEVLSISPKHHDAYLAIADLYLEMKQYANAKEAYRFLLKMAPNDPDVLIGLGTVAEEEGDAKGALAFFGKVRDTSPNNPKYLDYYIEAAIAAGDVHEATLAVDKLREVNEDNKKISSFEERIDVLRKGKKETK